MKTEAYEVETGHVVPRISWYREEGLGGMTREKEFVMQYVLHPKFNLALLSRLARLGTLNGGVLFYGPPGSGKTFLAKKTAQIWARADPTLSVRFIRGPELFDKMVGKTEETVREIFADAEKNIIDVAKGGASLRQHLVIIDEIDSMFGVRGKDQSSGVADRATATFISMMDDVNLRQNLFIIGTTNRYDMVDPAVVRSGRLGLHLKIAAMSTDDKADVLRLNLEKDALAMHESEQGKLSAE